MSDRGSWSDDQEGSEQWKRQTTELHFKCWNAVSDLRSAGYDTKSSLNAPQPVRDLENLVFEYRGAIQMKMPAEQTGGPVPFEDWDVDLIQVPVPQPGTYDGGRTNVYGEYDESSLLSEMDWQQRPVNLATLDEQWGVGGEIAVEVELNNGQEVVQKRFDPTLPIDVSRMCIQQIDRVVEDIGWVPPAREKAIHAEVLK